MELEVWVSRHTALQHLLEVVLCAIDGLQAGQEHAHGHIDMQKTATMLKIMMMRVSFPGLLCCLLVLQACALSSHNHTGSNKPDSPDKLHATDDAASQKTPLPAVSFDPYPIVQIMGAAKEPISSSGVLVWRHHVFPGKQPTQYAYERLDGRHSVSARASSSASMLRQAVRVEPANLGDIHFSWKVPQLIPGADLTRRETHDSPVRLVLVFEGDRSDFSMKNAMLSELSHALTGEELPYATLMYVWCNACLPESIFINPRTDRIREIVLEAGPAHLGRWLDYQRDIRADYQKAFGVAPGALLGVGLMTDTDNTRQNAAAWYGPVSLPAQLP